MCVSRATLAPPLKHALRSPNQTVAKRALEAVVQYVTCDARENAGHRRDVRSRTSLRFDCADVLGTLLERHGPGPRRVLKRIKVAASAWSSCRPVRHVRRAHYRWTSRGGGGRGGGSATATSACVSSSHVARRFAASSPKCRRRLTPRRGPAGRGRPGVAAERARRHQHGDGGGPRAGRRPVFPRRRNEAASTPSDEDPTPSDKPAALRAASSSPEAGHGRSGASESLPSSDPVKGRRR